jgi:hypothetical protein
MYSPIVAIDVAALNATAEPSDGRERMNARVAASRIVRQGLWKRSSTWSKKAGSARSRLKAVEPLVQNSNHRGMLNTPYIIRELDVMENSPQCLHHLVTNSNFESQWALTHHTQSITRTIATTAPSLPKTSTKICTTGLPYGDATVLSKSWIENSRHSI